MSKQEVIAQLETVLDPDHAQWVFEHRKTTIKKPLTVRAAQLLCGQFSKWHDPNEAADMMIERCWQGFKVDWMPQQTATPHFSGRRSSGSGGSGGSNSLTDAIVTMGFGQDRSYEPERRTQAGARNGTGDWGDARQLLAKQRQQFQTGH